MISKTKHEKYPAEKQSLTFDFVDLLGVATISSIAVTSTLAGVDSTATVIFSSSFSGSVVTVTIQGGLADDVHTILIQVTASDGSIHDHVGTLYILVPA